MFNVIRQEGSRLSCLRACLLCQGCELTRIARGSRQEVMQDACSKRQLSCAPSNTSSAA